MDIILPSSRWRFTDCYRYMACVKCGAYPGDYCRMPKGRKSPTPHIERLIAWGKVAGIEPYRNRLS